MDLMKPYMPATPENYQRVLKDIHAREIQMWAGCIWVPIYEVMTRKHLKLVTLEENLELAADIGMDATTSLDEAFGEAMERYTGAGEGARAAVRALPTAAQHRAHGGRAAALPAGGARPLTQHSVAASERRAAPTPPHRHRTRFGARRRSWSCCECSRTRPAACSRRSRCRAPTAAAPSTSR